MTFLTIYGRHNTKCYTKFVNYVLGLESKVSVLIRCLVCLSVMCHFRVCIRRLDEHRLKETLVCISLKPSVSSFKRAADTDSFSFLLCSSMPPCGHLQARGCLLCDHRWWGNFCYSDPKSLTDMKSRPRCQRWHHGSDTEGQLVFKYVNQQLWRPCIYMHL